MILSQIHFELHAGEFLQRFPLTLSPFSILNHASLFPCPSVSLSVGGATISRQKKSTVHSQFANKFACHALPVFQKKRRGRSEWSEQDSNKTETRPRTEKCGNVATSNSENAVPNKKFYSQFAFVAREDDKICSYTFSKELLPLPQSRQSPLPTLWGWGNLIRRKQMRHICHFDTFSISISVQNTCRQFAPILIEGAKIIGPKGVSNWLSDR